MNTYLPTIAAFYRTAIHEAGHAVIGLVLGLQPGVATILLDGDAAGSVGNADPYHVQAQWERDGKFRDMSSVFVGRILAVMAGAEAELEILGGRGRRCRGSARYSALTGRVE